MDGEVLIGELAGKNLSDLTDDELENLAAQLKDIDRESYALLYAYRMRRGNPIYYTDRNSREKSLNKIIAAKTISETEIDIKNKISAQLHDNIGGSLAALKMRLSQLNDPNYYKSLKSEINNLELIYNQVRDLSHDLNSDPKFTSSFYEKLDISINKMIEGFSSKSVNIFPKEQINNITDKNLQASILVNN